MINRKLKLINFAIILSLVFIAVTFSSYNNSYADHCAYPYTHDSNDDCVCSDDISDCSDPCGDGRLSSCDVCPTGTHGTPPDCIDDVCVAPETGEYPDCGECTTDQTGNYPNCVDNVCEPPEEGTYPDCGTCTVSGTSGYPTCICDSTGNAPTGTPPSCVVNTYCCNDETALNFDASCPDAANNKIEDNSGTCTFCTSDSTDPRCEVSYCPDTDPGGNSCKTANPDKNCTSDESSCKYYYCNKSTGRPDNYDPGGNDCTTSHPSPRVCEGDEFVCTYADVSYCDEYDNPDATNGQTKQDCEEWNDPHLCVSDDSVCSNPCTGNDCVEIAYCIDSLCGNYDAQGASCNSTKPADATCVPSLSACTSCTPYLYCGVPGFINYSDGAGCTDSHAVCASDISACNGTAACNIDFDVDVTCASGFTFTGTFAYAYQYDNTGQCVPPNEEELADIANYLEGRICTDVTPTAPPANIDWCTSIPGIQTSPDDCPIDVCPNLQGIQTTEEECGECPAGYYFDEDTGCTPIDMCPNNEDFPGNQTEIPGGHYLDGDGNCVIDDCDPPGSCAVNGVCGSASGTTLVSSIPSGTAACNFGARSSVSLINNTYSWNCRGVYGGTNSPLCSAPKGYAPACGPVVTHTPPYEVNYNLSNLTTLDFCSIGTVTNLVRSELTTVIPATTPASGEGTIDWKCNVGNTSTTCSAYSVGCVSGSEWCSAARICVPQGSVCPPVFLDAEVKLKTTGLVNRNETCTINMGTSISGENSNTLCTLRNVTTNTNVLTNFSPVSSDTYVTPPLTQDTLFVLVCAQDSIVDEQTGSGDGVLDSAELAQGVTTEGSCRLNLKSTEFN